MKSYSIKITAALLWISTGFSGQAFSAVCDVDNDGDVDRLDLRLIAGAYDTPSQGPDDPRDADGDGAITSLDLPVCIRQCSLAGCAIVGSAAPVPGKNAASPNPAGTGPTRNAVNGASNTVRGSATVGGAEWIVKQGDTLYSIGRSVFPRDTGKQELLRRDVIRLNPSVFADGADNMAVGAILRLPDYVALESTVAEADESIAATSPISVAITPGLVTQPVDTGPPGEVVSVKPRESVTAGETEPKPASPAMSENEAAETRRESATTANQASASALVSLGYSYGGDKLDDTGGSGDLHGGSGAHLRLGFEHMFEHGGGYRVALGLQYNLLREGGDNTTFRDAYLQLAYQYRASPLIYGVGIVVHTGPTLSAATTREYDAAAGAVAYLENVGSGALSGWGISYTSLEIEEQGTADSIDASRAELYYNWRF